MTFKVLTDHKVAFESPDHIHPVGTKNDNSTSLSFIEEVEKLFKKEKLNVMDLGCAGGQLVVDFFKRGHAAIGIEGSSYNVEHKQVNWSEYYEKILWTADVTKPFLVVDESNQEVKFDLITAWELIEHLLPEDLESFLRRAIDKLSDDGLFILSVNQDPDVRREKDGSLIFLHQSVFPERYWREEILKNFNVVNYPVKTVVRTMDKSFYIAIRRNKNEE